MQYRVNYALGDLAGRLLIAHRPSRVSAGSDELAVAESTRIDLGVGYERSNWAFDLAARNITNASIRRSADEDAPWDVSRSVVLTIRWRPRL